MYSLFQAQAVITPYILHFKQPSGTSRGVYTERKVWYVKPDSGNTSLTWGECAPLPKLSIDDLPDKEYMAILNRFVQRIERGERLVDLIPLMRPYPSILMGLETALWYSNRRSPVLADTAFARQERGIPINGLIWMGNCHEMKERIEEKLKLGFRCIKLKIGAILFEEELALIRQIRQTFSEDQIQLRVDANGAFLPGDDAMQKLEALSKYQIHSIEQPIRAGQAKEMACLCRNTPIPIALDEELIGHNEAGDKRRLLAEIHPQYIILKPSLHGGFYGSEEWISLAQEQSIGWWVTSALESNVGLNAIAHWCAMLQEGQSLYDFSIQPPTVIPQGLGTGHLFTNNIDGYPLTLVGDEMWCK